MQSAKGTEEGCFYCLYCFYVVLETGSLAWRYWYILDEHKPYIVHVIVLIYKNKLISCASDVYIILMHIFMVV